MERSTKQILRIIWSTSVTLLVAAVPVAAVDLVNLHRTRYLHEAFVNEGTREYVPVCAQFCNISRFLIWHSMEKIKKLKLSI